MIPFVLPFLIAIPSTPIFSPLDIIAAKCDNGDLLSCTRLATATDGQCASPEFMGGCNYDSIRQQPAIVQ